MSYDAKISANPFKLYGQIPTRSRYQFLLDHAQFERIYYVLVAGYDVFGNVSHQTNIRRYMDFLRIEGELNFLAYMPRKKRLAMLRSWYINDSDSDEFKYLNLDVMGNAIKYKTVYPKYEFINKLLQKQILPATGIHFDTLNLKKPGAPQPKIPKKLKTMQEFIQAARATSLAGSGFISTMTDSGANNIFLRIDMPDGSYPNVFVVVKFKDLPDFIDLMKHSKATDSDIKRMKKYFISRSDKDFWKIYDWFQADFYKKEPLKGGLYDLNRYARTPWHKEW